MRGGGLSSLVMDVIAFLDAKSKSLAVVMFELPNTPDDTSVESRKQIIGLLRQMSPTNKLSRIFDLSTFAKSLIVADMQQNNKYSSEMEFKRELAKRIYGLEEGSQIADFYK